MSPFFALPLTDPQVSTSTPSSYNSFSQSGLRNHDLQNLFKLQYLSPTPLSKGPRLFYLPSSLKSTCCFRDPSLLRTRQKDPSTQSDSLSSHTGVAGPTVYLENPLQGGSPGPRGGRVVSHPRGPPSESQGRRGTRQERGWASTLPPTFVFPYCLTSKNVSQTLDNPFVVKPPSVTRLVGNHFASGPLVVVEGSTQGRSGDVGNPSPGS